MMRVFPKSLFCSYEFRWLLRVDRRLPAIVRLHSKLELCVPKSSFRSVMGTDVSAGKTVH